MTAAAVPAPSPADVGEEGGVVLIGVEPGAGGGAAAGGDEAGGFAEEDEVAGDVGGEAEA